MLMIKLPSFSSTRCRHGPHFRALQLLRLSSSSTSVAATTSPARPPLNSHHIIVDYLVEKLGFSVEKATRASKYVSSLKSLDKPQSFVAFMKTHGFSDAQINKIVSGYPKCLAIKLDKTLAPKFRALNEIGFSGSDLTVLISSNCRVLSLDFYRKILPKIQFWQSLLGSREQLIKNLKRSNSFVADGIEKTVKPNIAFLRSCGVSDERIRMVTRKSPRFLIRRPQALAEAASRVENEMGIARDSGMFIWALFTLSSVSKVKLNGSLEIMKTFGWSEADFISASSKAPSILDLSHKMLSKKMEFLLKEAECEPVYVAQRPLLLMYSLEKRLIPRHKVVKILRSRGLLDREHMLASIMSYSDKTFVDKFIIPHKHNVPQLQEIYVDGCGK